MGREIIIGQEMPQWKHSAARYGHVTTVCGGHQQCHSPGYLIYASARKMGHQEKTFLERSGSLQESIVDADLGPVSIHPSSICWQPLTHQGCRQDLTVSPRLGNPALGFSACYCSLHLPYWVLPGCRDWHALSFIANLSQVRFTLVIMSFALWFFSSTKLSVNCFLPKSSTLCFSGVY